jgi:hypothetical protein
MYTRLPATSWSNLTVIDVLWQADRKFDSSLVFVNPFMKRAVILANGHEKFEQFEIFYVMCVVVLLTRMVQLVIESFFL